MLKLFKMAIAIREKTGSIKGWFIPFDKQAFY